MELQRGRARESAERLCRRSVTSWHLNCFNGAALVRARKDSPQRARNVSPNVLQRGRARESAERWRHTTNLTLLTRLQRGRARESAESQQLHDQVATALTELQRGRARESAERRAT